MVESASSRPAASGVGGSPQKITKGKRRQSATNPRRPPSSFALVLAFRHEGREMLNEHIRIVLKDVMDDRGKRLDVNVRPVSAALLQVIPEGGEGLRRATLGTTQRGGRSPLMWEGYAHANSSEVGI